MYRYFIKRLIDIVASAIAIVLLTIPMLVLALIIVLDDPGPILFKQKRVGKKKNGELTYFMILKFRSMRKDAPRDVPTHLFENPEQFTTRVGKFIRKSSLDELPQIYQVFTGKLSFIGPRPALWTQKDLIEEREKYGVNDITPGITGWAQTNGRDELDIPVKAKFDGEYAQALRAGRFKGVIMDARCFCRTIKSVCTAEGVVEGKKEEQKEEKVIK